MARPGPFPGRAWRPSRAPAARCRRPLESPFFIQVIALENRVDQFARQGHTASLTTKHDLVPFRSGILDQFQQGGNDFFEALLGG